MIVHQQEAVRLRALDLCKVLDTQPERDYDRLVFTASQALRAPIVTISLVDAARSWAKARVGVGMIAVPRIDSFTAIVVESGQLTVIEDVAKTVRHARHPLLRREPRVRFYAGAPLFGPSGQVVGAFSVLDRQPRSLTPDEERMLTMLAREATDLLMRRVDPAARGPD